MKILNLILDIAVIALPLFFVIGCIIASIIEANEEHENKEFESETIKKTNKKVKKNRFELKNYSK